VVTIVAYLLFYTMVLDRVGVHLYPIFSPRNSYCILVWSAVLGAYYGLFHIIYL
jgi:hypothetical protein